MELGGLSDLIWPVRCAGCGGFGSALCARCLPQGLIEAGERPGVRTVACGPYDGALRRAVLAFKERGRRALAGPLGDALALTLAQALAGRHGPTRVPPPDPAACIGQEFALVPAPTSAAAVRARGYDHTRLLARRVGRVGDLPVVSALTVTRAVADSAALGARERRLNLAGALAARPPPRSTSVAVLIDDVVTTGATLGESARALRAAGWTVTLAVVVAAAGAPSIGTPGPSAPRLPPGHVQVC